MIIAGCCSKPSHVLVLLANEIRWSMEHKNISTNDEVKQTNSHSVLIAPYTPSQKWYEIVQFPFVLSTTTTVVLIIMVLAMAFRVYEKKRFAVYWWYKSMSLGRRGIKSKNLSLSSFLWYLQHHLHSVSSVDLIFVVYLDGRSRCFCNSLNCCATLWPLSDCYSARYSCQASAFINKCTARYTLTYEPYYSMKWFGRVHTTKTKRPANTLTACWT